MKDLDQTEADECLHRAAAYLAAPGRRLAALGWSFGARQAMRAALMDLEWISAAVVYYGRTVNDVSQLKRLQGPVQVVYATQERAWPDNKEQFEAAMAEAGKTVESCVFEAGHGFVNPESQRYDARLAEEAWACTRAFLERSFR